jgi:hypothetical protein
VKLQRQFEDFEKALSSLAEALRQPKNAFIRDSAILRFELLFETAWKTAQSLSAAEGFIVNSPKTGHRSIEISGCCGRNSPLRRKLHRKLCRGYHRR